MTMKQQKAPQKKIAKQVMKPAKPAGEGMGMAPHKPVHNLGKFAHPPKKKG
jgi:hypothetical protein